MEEHVIIAGAAVDLEGRLLLGGGRGGWVITHPHPRYGGSMDNNVVWTAGRAGAARGWTTLRFNFRGVGQSTGSFGDGLAEVADLAAALTYLQTRTPGPYYVVGYSFGAFVAARAMLQGLEAEGALLLAPPIAFMDLAFLPAVPRLKLLVAGDRDELCPLADLRELLRDRRGEPPDPVPLEVIAGADHFFGGAEDQLFRVLRDFPLEPLRVMEKI
jgi:alpha/beta superfamily hydrolase